MKKLRTFFLNFISIFCFYRVQHIESICLIITNSREKCLIKLQNKHECIPHKIKNTTKLIRNKIIYCIVKYFFLLEFFS